MNLTASPARPVSVLTHEQNIIWSTSELIRGRSLMSTKPALVTEQYGFYPSNRISVVPIDTVDGGECHVVRLLIPVASQFYASTSLIYPLVGTIVP